MDRPDRPYGRPDDEKGHRHPMPRYNDGPGFMGYLFRFLLVLLLLAGLGLAAFAFIGDLSRPPEPRLLPLTLGAG